MVEYFEALEADFARYYHVDLPASLWGPAPMSARRFSVLTRALPEGSATGHAAASHPQWDQTDELLATIAEVIDVGNRAFIHVHSKPSAAPPDPIRIRRPWEPASDPTPERRMSTPAEIAAFFQATTRNGTR